MRRLLILLIRFYQRFLSPLKPPCCRFEPSCSSYAVEALQKRGVMIGTLLALWRILRCNPFGGFGYDPVPLSKAEKRLATSVDQHPAGCCAERVEHAESAENNVEKIMPRTAK